MCEPITLSTLATVSLGLTAASGVMGAVGVYRQGQAASEAAKAKSKVANMQAEDAKRIGRMDEKKAVRKSSAAASTQQAQFASMGIDPTTGVAADIQSDTARAGMLDALTIRYNTAKESWGLKTNSAMAVAEARNAKKSALFNAGTTLLGSSAKVADKWYRYFPQ
jgi:hypothetical protein